FVAPSCLRVRRSAFGGKARGARACGAARLRYAEGRMKGRVALALIGGALAASGAARADADLGADAERVVRMWTLAGAVVERRSPVFLEHGRIRAVSVVANRTAAAEAGAAAADATACTTVLFLAGRAIDFAIDTVDDEGGALPGRPLRRDALPGAGG